MHGLALVGPRVLLLTCGTCCIQNGQMAEAKGGDVHAAYSEMGTSGGEARKEQVGVWVASPFGCAIVGLGCW